MAITLQLLKNLKQAIAAPNSERRAVCEQQGRVFERALHSNRPPHFDQEFRHLWFQFPAGSCQTAFSYILRESLPTFAALTA